MIYCTYYQYSTSMPLPCWALRWLVFSFIAALKDQLRLSSEACEEYRKAADRLELTLRENTAASQHMQESLESKNTQLQTGKFRIYIHGSLSIFLKRIWVNSRAAPEWALLNQD